MTASTPEILKPHTAVSDDAVLKSLDHVLELVGRRPLSAVEFRLLLGLVERDATVSQLAEALGDDPAEISETGRRLALPGLVRWRRVGSEREVVLGLTAAGLKEVRPLITAASGVAAPEDSA
jgi:DNA-binding MarR family transcriptional regulator